MECFYGSHVEEQKHLTELTIKFLHCLSRIISLTRQGHENTPFRGDDLFILIPKTRVIAAKK